MLLLILIFSFFSFLTSFYETITKDFQVCSGMYKQDDISNGKPSYIEVTSLLKKTKEDNNEVGVAVYSREDTYKGGSKLTPQFMEIVCQGPARPPICKEQTPLKESSNFETYILDALETRRFEIKNTNYYCVTVGSKSTEKTLAKVKFMNPYGHLSGTDYPKLKFYGLMTVLYVLVLIYWVVCTIKHYDSILKIQNYILGVLVCLVLEMCVNYWYESYKNTTGNSSYYVLVLCIVLDSARNSLCFFTLLIVCLGYGVIKPRLGRVMLKCKVLTSIHFFCNLVLNTFFKLGSIDDTGFVILLFIMPLSMSITTFFVWIMNGLNHSILYLQSKKQHIKLKMFNRIKKTLQFAIGTLLLLFVVSSILFPKGPEIDSYQTKWKYQWFIVEGWQVLLFFMIFLVITVLWRPTFNNQRYGLAQLPQDETDADMLDMDVRNPTEYNNENEFDIGNLSDEDVANIFEMGKESDASSGISASSKEKQPNK